MSDQSAIEWTDATWNPVTGCTNVSPGCDHCYAETFAERFRGVEGHHFERGFDLTLRPGRLTQPLRWTRPRRVFVNSMSDMFHADIGDDFIARVFAVMALAPQHTFQLLTKRHARMRSLLSSPAFTSHVADTAYLMSTGEHADVSGSGSVHRAARVGYAKFEAAAYSGSGLRMLPWPLPNVWLGVSVEDQHWADIRIPALMETPSAVRWISAEPLLGPVKLSHLHTHCPTHDFPGGFCVGYCPDRRYLDWVVVGGESGRGARPMHPEWARGLRDQCVSSEVPFLFKQWGAWAAVEKWTGRESDQAVPLDGKPAEPGRVYSVEETLSNAVMRRVGKKAAGRELDGRTWDEYPGGVS